jgi:GntP family gluconate:H+ symporter
MEPESNVALTLKFLGEPLVALGIAVLAATVVPGLGQWHLPGARRRHPA